MQNINTIVSKSTEKGGYFAKKSNVLMGSARCAVSEANVSRAYTRELFEKSSTKTLALRIQVNQTARMRGLCQSFCPAFFKKRVGVRGQSPRGVSLTRQCRNLGI
jgi:hypothetical protein